MVSDAPTEEISPARGTNTLAFFALFLVLLLDRDFRTGRAERQWSISLSTQFNYEYCEGFQDFNFYQVLKRRAEPL
jgi:hypothetical protein